MGCGTSTSKTKPEGEFLFAGLGHDWGDYPSYTQIINEKCPHVRLDTISAPKKMVMKGASFDFNIRYSYVSQRGYYPNALTKANQDSYLVLENILGDANSHCFGIFDGHGEYGDFCSHYAANQFSSSLAKELRDAGGVDAMDSTRMETLYTSAFVKTNKLLKKSPIDDSLSGTTGVTIVLKGDTLYVGNVGDSRAIIASEIDGKLRYSPLSSDQTPFRKDERERLKKCGAYIMTIDQIDGNEPMHDNWGAETGDEIDDAAGDPPRVWDSTLEKPGCAFTRSFGDSVAESIGVYAEPEILTWKLQPNDKFAIVASDGVFEFLPSQAVVDMVAGVADPLEATKSVVAEAYRLWLQFDERTDDITMITINFDDIKAREGVTLGQANANISRPVIEDRPVRRVAAKSKRKDISEDFEDGDDAGAGTEFDFEAESTPKTPDELARVAAMVKNNFMLANLSPLQREQIFAVMRLQTVEAGQDIIKEGDKGDAMYIIDSGEFTVHKYDEGGTNQLVFTYTNPGATFGELSLMYGKPRAASVAAKTNGRLWSIGRLAFRAVLVKKKQEGMLKMVAAIPMFKDIKVPALHKLCLQCVVESFNDNDSILKTDLSAEAKMGDGAEDREKSAPWVFCVVLQGGIKMNPKEASEKPVEEGGKKSPRSPRKQVRGEGSFLALAEVVGDKASYVSCLADGRTKVLFVPQKLFQSTVGSSGVSELNEAISSKKFKGKPNKRKLSIFSNPDALTLQRVSDRTDFALEAPAIVYSNFAYIGTFNHQTLGKCSCKVIAKKNAESSKMATRLLQERQILAAIGASQTDIVHTLPKIASCYQDSKVLILAYSDIYVCDLALAIANNAIPEAEKPFYCACMVSALTALHDEGIMHRFINPGSFLITPDGIPKLVDLRYAKKMDGCKSYTICGDPVYFAPEIVSQQGYDFSADLWSLGAVIFEIHEGSMPIATPDMEETLIFKKILAFVPDEHLEFTKKSSKKARSLVTSLLEPDASRRTGYKGGSDDVKGKKMFAGMTWAGMGKQGQGGNMDLAASVDPSTLFVEKELEECTSATFGLF